MVHGIDSIYATLLDTPLILDSLQLEMPAYALLKELGCPSTLTNQWRSMRHRLRRRLARPGVPKGARGPRASKAASVKGPVQSQAFSNGSSEAASLVSAGASDGRKPIVSPRATGGNDAQREEIGVASRAEEDTGRVEHIDVGSERSVKRARTEAKLEGEQAASS